MNHKGKPLYLFLVVTAVSHMTLLTSGQQDFTVAAVPNPFQVGDMYPPRSEVDVCRQIQDYIVQSSTRYDSQLVTNTNQDINFSTANSRIMSSRLQSRLNTLATLYKNAKGRKMTILKAWTPFPDPDLSGDDLSLHYEGRTVQVRLSRSGDYDDLLLLAVQAAFDWVYFARSNLIRLSVIPTSCDRNIDCAFILDQSGSVGSANHEDAKRFIENVVSFFTISSSNTRIGLVTYSSSARIEFNLNAYDTLSELQTAIRAVPYRGGRTSTALALNRTTSLLDPSTNRGARVNSNGIPKIAILITDGKSNNYVLDYAAPALKNSGVQVYSIGIGNYDTDELVFIASEPDNEHVFVLSSYRDALGFVDFLSVTTCETQAVVQSCDDTVTSIPEETVQYYQSDCSTFSSSALVELTELQGSSFLYCSTTVSNPGPLTSDTIKNETVGVTKRQCLLTLTQASHVIFIGVKGQGVDNTFSLIVMDNMFSVSEISATTVEGVGGVVYDLSQNLLPAFASTSFQYEIIEGNNVLFSVSNGGILQIQDGVNIDFEMTPAFELVIMTQTPNSDCNCARLTVNIEVLRNRIDFVPPTLSDIEVAEDRDIGYDIIQIVTSGGAGEIAFSIVNGNVADAFRIGSSSGIIEVSSDLDFETRMTYTLTIQATSIGTSVSATINQTITVTDVNESPFFTTNCALNVNGGGCYFSIDENEQSGTVVGNISASDPDLVSLANGMISYRFQPLSSHFAVDSSGRVTTSQVLDREDIDTHSLVLVVSDGSSCCSISVSTPVSIAVNDLNDNAPVIVGMASLRVTENSVPGSAITQYEATDADTSLHSNIEFSISPSNVPFNIDPNEGTLAVSGTIDYESVQQYTVTVTAANPGTSQSSSITVQIDVTNLNDESPVFVNVSLVTIVEHSSVNELAITVQATDADRDPFGEVSYSILAGNFRNSFIIGTQTGEIRVASDIDRETISMFQLIIQAINNGGSQSRHTTAEVSIIISDINDNHPIFNPDMYYADLREDIALNTEIFTASAFDNDEPRSVNSDIIYSISLGNAGSTFSIDQDSGIVSLNEHLDFEVVPTYQITIVATDRGSPQLSGTAMATITVLNVNELPPVVSGNQTIEVAENEPIGSSIADFDAVDPDQMSITFQVASGNNENRFSINESTGTINLVGSLDYETRQNYLLEIVVSDGSQVTRAFLLVNILDINEFTPTFNGSTTFEINEEEPNGSLVGTVSAEDLDGSVTNSLVTYSFAQQSQITQYFNLDPQTGDIVTNGVLDREQLTQVFPPPTSNQTVDIVARDGGSPSKQSSRTITIVLLDINDNAPVFAEQGYENSLQENLGPNHVVFQLAATDADLGSNAEIRFLFELTNNLGSSVPFLGDEITGLIITNESLDCEQQPSYNFVLKSVDLGIPRLTSNVTGVLNIIDENDNSPIFTMETYSVNVLEDVLSGVVIAQVVANDTDKGSNGEIVYSVINNERIQDIGENQEEEISFLEIDSSTGELWQTTFFDYEMEQVVNVTVIATDMGIPRRSGSATVVFEIENVDESAPTFINSVCQATIPESTAVNEVVTQCIAVDSDSTPSNDEVLVSYTILSGNDDNLFEINITSGEIILVGELDRETRFFYQVGVQAQDLSGQTSIKFVEITVSDVNDNAPQFEAPSYRYDFTVVRIQIHTQQLVTVSATDADIEENSLITYSMGDILRNDLSTVIEIIATDNGSPAMFTSTELTVHFERMCLLQEYSITPVSGVISAYVVCSIEISPPVLDVVLGSTNTLQCSVLFNSRMDYQWIQNGTVITPPTFIENRMTDFRYIVDGERFEKAGEYACKVSTSAGSIQTETSTVNILVHPTITVPPKDQTVKLGDEAVFTCTAVGIPDPKVEWYFKDSQKVHEGSRLVISDVSASNAGTYNCVIRNKATSTPVIASAKLILYTPNDVVELTLTDISRTSEDGSCHIIDYDAIASAIHDLTFLSTMFTKVNGENICEVSPCIPSPCKNGGSCELNENVLGGYVCTCSRGYTGKNCDQDTEECSDSPCQNGGSCVEEIGSFSCGCANGTSGYICQYQDSCKTTNSCTQTELCVDTISDTGYQCVMTPDIASSLTVTIVGTNAGFLEDLILAYIEQFLASSSPTGRRKRQSTTFSTSCVPRFVQVDLTMNLYVLLWLCPDGDLPPTGEQQNILCSSVILGDDSVLTCKPPGGDEMTAITPQPLPDSSAIIGLILFKASSSVPLDGKIVEEELEKVQAVSKISQMAGVEVVGIKAQQSGAPDSGGNTPPPVSDPAAGIVVGVLLCLLVIAALVATVVIATLKFKEHQKRQNRKREHALEKASSTDAIEFQFREPPRSLTNMNSTTALVGDNDYNLSPPLQSIEGDNEVITNDAAV